MGHTMRELNQLCLVSRIFDFIYNAARKPTGQWKNSLIQPEDMSLMIVMRQKDILRPQTLVEGNMMRVAEAMTGGGRMAEIGDQTGRVTETEDNSMNVIVTEGGMIMTVIMTEGHTIMIVTEGFMTIVMTESLVKIGMSGRNINKE